jgi:hypothetical protein
LALGALPDDDIGWFLVFGILGVLGVLGGSK